jgi:hypothetical protein
MANWLVRQCERCKTPVKDRELSLVRRELHDQQRRLHVGCLTELEKHRVLFARHMRCIFCGQGSMTMAQLIDHFGYRHGRVLVNW